VLAISSRRNELTTAENAPSTPGVATVNCCALKKSSRSSGGPVFFIDPASDDLEYVIRQRPLQSLRLIPWRTHPDVALLVGRQDHRHCLGMDRLDDDVRCRGQKSVNEMRPANRLRLGASVARANGTSAAACPIASSPTPARHRHCAPPGPDVPGTRRVSAAVANIVIYRAKERDDRGLVRRDAVEIAGRFQLGSG
jgi:hypothetical protein